MPRTSTRSDASAQTWVTGSSGSGTTRTHPCSDTTLIPSTSTRSAPSSVSCSIRVRMIRPFCSNGVGTSSCTIGMGGMASTISAREACPAPAGTPGGPGRPRRRRRAGTPGRRSLPAGPTRSETPPDAAASSSPDDESGVSITSTPRAAHKRASTVARGHRQRDPVRRRPPRSNSSMNDHDRLVVAQHAPGAVDQREALAAGVDHRAEVGARTADGVGHPRLAHDAVDGDHPRRLRVRVDAQHVGAAPSRGGWA